MSTTIEVSISANACVKIYILHDLDNYIFSSFNRSNLSSLLSNGQNKYTYKKQWLCLKSFTVEAISQRQALLFS